MRISAPIDLVEKAVKSFQNEVRRKKDQVPQFPERVVAIFRHLGKRGKRVAELLKKWLEWPVWDKELLGVLADLILIAAAHKCGLKNGSRRYSGKHTCCKVTALRP